MGNRWREIWESKGKDAVFDYKLQSLLTLNGFDTKSGIFDLGGYNDFIIGLSKKLQLDKNKSIFELGCGSGAFLYALLGEGGGGNE